MQPGGLLDCALHENGRLSCIMLRQVDVHCEAERVTGPHTGKQ